MNDSFAKNLTNRLLDQLPEARSWALHPLVAEIPFDRLRSTFFPLISLYHTTSREDTRALFAEAAAAARVALCAEGVRGRPAVEIAIYHVLDGKIHARILRATFYQSSFGALSASVAGDSGLLERSDVVVQWASAGEAPAG